jgi:tetratricopeptide (TPR) repeat protein
MEIEALALVSEFLRELGEVQGALAACDRALAACEARGKVHVPQRVRADVLRSRGVLLRRVGRVSEAVDAYVEAVAVFRKTNSRRQEARAKDDLAFAMIVQGRYEDAVALALEAIQIDLSIGGRFQLAKTLTTIGYAYSFLGDAPRALAYLRRARDAHERYGDQDTRTGTLLATAEAHLEAGDLASADSFLRDARALNAATSNAYETTHAAVVAAALALASGDALLATECALEARRAAEHQALTSFHFYGLALEASARATIGELHAATLLATTALGAVETLQGCEYGLEIRALSAEALEIAGSPQASLARQRAVDHAVQLAEGIHEIRLRRLFTQRPRVARLLGTVPGGSGAPSGTNLEESNLA